jgi:hypothetical protein
METVVILGLIIISIGGYLRYHRARVYAPLTSRQPLRVHDADPMGADRSNSGDCP